MKNYLKKLPKEIISLLDFIGDLAAKDNLPVYLVGGFVRDLILGVKNLDLDIVVEGDGIKFAENLSVRLKARLISHKRFGTATLILKDGFKIDVASARKEFYPQPAHLPVVENSTLKDDHFRRDFTINAMALSIGKGNSQELIDFFGGESDLKSKRIRVLHSLSFIDDPTRILRAVRFEQRYDFRIEPATLKLLKEANKQKMLERVDPQRIRDELILMLKEERPIKEIKRLKRITGFNFIDKLLLVSNKTLALLTSIEREIEWFKKVNSSRRPLDAWVMYFIGLVDELPLKDLRCVIDKLKLRKGEEKRILSFKDIPREVINELSKPDIKPSDLYHFLEPLSYEVMVLLKAKYKNHNLNNHIKDFLQIYNDTRISVGGKDLSNLGILPGPHYQKILSKVMIARLDGVVKTKEEELALIRKLEKIS